MALPSLKQLTYFVKLVETRHFTEAAQQCFVTQSTLSGGIQELEKALGGVLFERSRQSVNLTDFGQQVLPRAERLLAEAKELVQLAAELSEPLTGLVKLAIIPTIAPFIISDLVQSVQKNWPKLQLQFFELQSAHAVEQLTKGEVDFVLLALPYHTDDFNASIVHEDFLKLIVHKDFIRDAQIQKLIEQQMRQDKSAATTHKLDDTELTFNHLLLMEEGHCLRDHTLTICPLGTSASQAGFETSNLLSLLQLVQAKIGYGFIPEIALRSGLLPLGSSLIQLDLKKEPVRQIALLSRRTSTKKIEHQQLTKLLSQLFNKLQV